MQSDAANIIDLYRRHAVAWATLRGTTVKELKWLERFMALLPKNVSILDIGCGSGDPIGRYLLGQGYDLTGIDASPELINIAKAQVQAADWRVCDMRNMDLGAEFDELLA